MRRKQTFIFFKHAKEMKSLYAYIKRNHITQRMYTREVSPQTFAWYTFIWRTKSLHHKFIFLKTQATCLMKSRGIIRLCQHSPHPSPISGISSGCKPFFSLISLLRSTLKGLDSEHARNTHIHTRLTGIYLYFLLLPTTEDLLIVAAEEYKSICCLNEIDLTIQNMTRKVYIFHCIYIIV